MWIVVALGVRINAFVQILLEYLATLKETSGSTFLLP